jgi:hypothetical protein
MSLSAARVARIGYDGFMRGQRVVVAGFGNRLGLFALRFVPNAVLLALLDWGTRWAARKS